MTAADHTGLSIDPGQRFRLAKEVVLQDFTGKALLVDLNGERVYQLNESGARVARLLVAGQTLREISAVLQEEYQASPGELARDVQQLLSELLEQGLVERREENP